MCMCGWCGVVAGDIIIYGIERKERESTGGNTQHCAQSSPAKLAERLQRTSSSFNIQQLPELALRCAQFFHSLSQYCLQYYRNGKANSM
jgi:hypothetical protein